MCISVMNWSPVVMMVVCYNYNDDDSHDDNVCNAHAHDSNHAYDA